MFEKYQHSLRKILSMRLPKQSSEIEKESSRSSLKKEEGRECEGWASCGWWYAIGCTVIAAIVNQLVRIVNKSPFYNSTMPHHTTFV